MNEKIHEYIISLAKSSIFSYLLGKDTIPIRPVFSQMTCKMWLGYRYGS